MMGDMSDWGFVLPYNPGTQCWWWGITF